MIFTICSCIFARKLKEMTVQENCCKLEGNVLFIDRLHVPITCLAHVYESDLPVWQFHFVK